ncbi:uncharacterized protein V1518DRAFT_420747, partial [Limtongia smithiae]|uniref:uncharacterized protein n=1 Tax=Limtongia smithiae TaxID=1125753 RepID=UPI0034CD357E
MRFSTVFTAISALAAGAAAAVYDGTLMAVSDDATVNTLNLSSIHEGAAINYFFLGDYGQDLTYSSDNSTFLAWVLTQAPFYVQIYGDILMFAVDLGDIEQFTLTDDLLLSVNG